MQKNKIYSNEKIKEKAYLFGVALKKNVHMESDLAELVRLCETAGLEIVGQDFQVIREVTPATLIGSGKVEEIKQRVEELDVDVVVVDANLTGSQAKNLSEIFGVNVIDRTSLILDIFAMRATTDEGKLQVALAKLKYSPLSLKFEDRDIGNFRNNLGEKKSRTMKFNTKQQIQKMTEQLAEIKNKRALTRQKRNFGNKKQVAIVGYTNAGKSTLLNLITKADIYADDKLFATLDTTSRNVFLSPEVQIILTDTVGFISKLPHELVEAFSSTLEEAKMADLILHVVDVSNPDFKLQMETVQKTLARIGADKIPQIVVYNKVDNILPADPFVKLGDNEVLISAKKKIGIEELKNKIVEFFEKSCE